MSLSTNSALTSPSSVQTTFASAPASASLVSSRPHDGGSADGPSKAGVVISITLTSPDVVTNPELVAGAGDSESGLTSTVDESTSANRGSGSDDETQETHQSNEEVPARESEGAAQTPSRTGSVAKVRHAGQALVQAVVDHPVSFAVAGLIGVDVVVGQLLAFRPGAAE